MSQPGRILSDLPPRLDRLPWSRFHWMVFFIIGVGYLLDGFEVSVYGSVLGPVAKLFHVPAFWASALLSIFLIGAFVGAMGFGYLADRLGRRRLFVVTLTFYAAATVLSALSWNYASLAVFRFLTGVGIGGEYGAVDSAIQEFIPSARRGFATGMIPGMWDIGTVIASLLSYFALSYLPAAVGWRVAFLFGAIIAVFVAGVRRLLPESPRWLLGRGRTQQAAQVVEQIEAAVKREHGLSQLPSVTPVEVEQAKDHGFWHHYGEIIRNYPRQTALAWILNFCETLPYYSAFSLIPVILTFSYKYPTHAVPLLLTIVTLAGVLGVFVMSFLADAWGRRASVTLSYGLAGVMALITGIMSAAHAGFGWFIAALAVTYFFAFAAAAVVYVTTTEIFPTSVRAAAISASVAFGRIGGIIGPVLLTAMLAISQEAAFVLTGIVLLIGAVAELVLGIEGRGRSLEEISSSA